MNNQTMLRVRKTTKQTLRQIAEKRGWKIAEAAERAAEALAKQEKVTPIRCVS